MVLGAVVRVVVGRNGDRMSNVRRKKYTQRIEFARRTDKPKDEQAKERMAEALAAYQGPITKCPPESELKNALSASSNVSKRWTRPK
jgi:hypothetical protein